MNTVAPPTTIVPVAVLGGRVERVVQPQPAFSGTNSARLLMTGVLLILAGLAITIAGQLVTSRRAS